MCRRDKPSLLEVQRSTFDIHLDCIPNRRRMAKQLQSLFSARPAISPLSTGWSIRAAEPIAIVVKAVAAAWALAFTKFTRLLLAGFIDSQRTPIQNFSIQLGYCRFQIDFRS
jgi:hypothetical protein